MESRSSVCIPGIDKPANILVRDKGRELEPDPELDEFCFVFELLPDKPRNIKSKIREGSLLMRNKTQTEKKANFKKINGKEVS